MKMFTGGENHLLPAAKVNPKLDQAEQICIVHQLPCSLATTIMDKTH